MRLVGIFHSSIAGNAFGKLNSPRVMTFWPSPLAASEIVGQSAGRFQPQDKASERRRKSKVASTQALESELVVSALWPMGVTKSEMCALGAAPNPMTVHSPAWLNSKR